MMLIDFEDKFSQYLDEYEHENDLGDGELDEAVPDLYLDWLKTPKEWLSGKSPVDYFASFEASELIAVFGEYIFSEMAVPGVMLNRIADTKTQTYPFLISLLKNYEGEKSDQLKTYIVRMIEEMDLGHPYKFYIEVISGSDESGLFPEACAQELKNSGEAYIEDIIAAYESATNRYASDCFLDILTDLPYDERVYQFALDKFLYENMKKAFYASCLGKIGNENAIPYLEEALKDESTAYFDYVSIRNAIEELGGEISIERDFTGDKDYESLTHREERI